MTTRFNTKACLGGFALLVSAALLSVACGDDSNNSPSGEDPVLTGGTSSSGGKGGTGNGTGGENDGDGGDDSSSGGKGGKGGSSNSGGTGATGGSGGSGGTPPAQECEPELNEDDECWVCPQLQPEDTELEYRDEQFRKQCTDSTCEPFDNADRIPGFDPEDPFPEALP